MLNKTFKNNRGREFKVVKLLPKRKVLVQFKDTGYTKEAYIDNITKGKCADPYEPTKLGVGCLGIIDKSLPYWKRAHQLWSNMLARCYSDNPKSNGYKWKGVTVDSRWLCFENFLKDLPDLENFDKWLNKEKMNLDKDLKVEGNIVYSKQACMFVSEGLNKSEGAKTTVSGYRRSIESGKD